MRDSNRASGNSNGMTWAFAMPTREAGNKEGKSDKAMVMATRVASDGDGNKQGNGNGNEGDGQKVDNGKGSKSNGNSNSSGKQQRWRGHWQRGQGLQVVR